MIDRSSTYDEQLPWLEPVDDEDEPRGVSASKMLAALGVVLLAAVLVAVTFFWLGRRDPVQAGGAPELIRAEPGPYKIRPPNPGGLDVAGESETAFQTSAGEDTDAELDMGALPQPPAAAPAKEEPKRIPPNETKEPVAAEEPVVAPTGVAGSVIQLGAYKNAAQAERAWTVLSNRFPNVRSLNKMIVPFSGGIRLRAGAASPAAARDACQALKAAGESCFLAN
jgi:hypothetical protein